MRCAERSRHKHVHRFVPQSIGILRIERVRGDASEIAGPSGDPLGLVAVLEIAASHAVQERHDAAAREAGRTPQPSVAAEILHFFGEVEVVFGLWAVPLVLAIAATHGWDVAKHYVNDTVNYTEALFVVDSRVFIVTKDRNGVIYGSVEFWLPPSNAITRFQSTMFVPEEPTARGTLFLWPGLQPLRGPDPGRVGNGVLQPVLTWGTSCAPKKPA